MKRLLIAAMVVIIAALLWVFTRPTPQSARPIAQPTRVDRIHVDKSDHILKVFKNGREVRSFKVALGRGGLAPKQKQGDGRVPEGTYLIVGRNPQSAFYLSLRIGYPTAQQAAEERRRGVDPGNDIMIHGLPNGRGALGERHRLLDWTAGCIAVTNEEMDWLWASVPNNTPIEIVQ